MSQEENTHMSTAASCASAFGTVILVSSVLICLNRNRNSDAFTWLVSLLISIFFAPIYLPYAIISCGGEANAGDGSFFKTSCFSMPIPIEKAPAAVTN